MPFLLGKMLAAEIRYRAAGDGSFLLPAGRSVKRQPKSACRAKPLAGADLAGVEGLEPPTPGFGDRCSSH
jgi:hypothetical protein